MKDPSSLKPAPPYGCETCRDTGWEEVYGADGHKLGVRQCRCLADRLRDQRLACIPDEYRGAHLESLVANPARHPQQAAAIEIVRAQPDSTFVLLGPSGVGKTLLAWTLYRRAVEQGRPAVCLPLMALLRQFREAERGDGRAPDVTAEALKQRDARYFVGLDDFGAARPSPFAAEMLFELLDAAYGFHHQVVVTANVRAAQLRAHWAQAGEGYGPTILRRIFEARGSVNVDFFPKEGGDGSGQH